MKAVSRFTQIMFSYWRFAIAAALFFASAGMAVIASQGTAPESKVYIVQLIDPPVASYEGGIAGYKATKPAAGKKIDPLASDVTKYVARSNGRHHAALARAGNGKKLYDYNFTFNGFAAELTADQAAKLATDPDVRSVTPDELREMDTSSTPGFLGLTTPGGLWDQLGGPSGNKKLAGAGDGIIIGIIDSGIWPESKSFTDRDEKGKLIYQQIPGWHGKCKPGEDFNASMCNQKLIGGQFFNASWGGSAALEAQRPWEFMSVRDYNGHGTHTASTSGGNHNTATNGPATGLGSISGIAPRARISAYKALWSTETGSTASGFTGDLVAAIDQAVADGVDVINYSISGTRTNFLDPVEVAYFHAANAGVFVSQSAGNSGPTTSTVAHPSPWTTTVAAGTHNRSGTGSVTLGNAATYSGASLAAAVGPAPFINAEDAGLAGADATRVRLCYAAVDNGGTPVLDPAKVSGKIVLCDRGDTARVNKSLAVSEAGGVGAVLANVTPASLNADFHSVPTVHVADTDRAALKAYAATSSPTAKINQSTITFSAPAPLTAGFSSRGPLLAGGGDLLKPDVIAPGVDILAAVAPPGQGGLNFNLLSGTSMSSPHVAGLAAILKQRHPTWSPMAIKSALMTTGSDILDGPNTNPLVIFRQGAGHVRPNNAADPGLVYDSNSNDWLAFLCGTTTGVNPSTCTSLASAGHSLDPSDLNLASIAIGDLAGIQTVKRKVRNVGSSAATYTASVTGMAGLTVVVNPSSLSVNPGETKSFTVTFTRTTAALNAYVGGQLTWSNGTHTVRSPLVVRPVALAAPASVFGTGENINYGVTFGYDGAFTASARGLVPATLFPGTVMDDPGNSFTQGGPGTVSFDVVVPVGTTHARFSLFDDFTDGNDDLDLYVYRVSTNALVGSSGGGTSAEEVNLLNPAADTYRVWVHAFGTDGPDANFTLFAWVLGSSAAGNMAMTAPASAVLGTTGNIELIFSSLSAGTRYMGSVAYSGTPGLPNPTIVRVDTP